MARTSSKSETTLSVDGKAGREGRVETVGGIDFSNEQEVRVGSVWTVSPTPTRSELSITRVNFHKKVKIPIHLLRLYFTHFIWPYRIHLSEELLFIPPRFIVESPVLI